MVFKWIYKKAEKLEKVSIKLIKSHLPGVNISKPKLPKNTKYFPLNNKFLKFFAVEMILKIIIAFKMNYQMKYRMKTN